MKFALVLCSFFLILGCTKKKEEDPRLTDLRHKAAEEYERSEKLEADIKLSIQDEGKQNFLRHDLELSKSRILRLKEEAKKLNGGTEVNLEPPKKTEEGGGGH